MAKIKFSRKEIEKSFKITPEIEKKINLFGTHLESIDDENIELEILPNRPDLFSLQGFVRNFKSFLGKEPGLKKYKINNPEKNYLVKIDSNLKEIRPFTACAIVKSLSFNDEKIKEIIDLQEKIHLTLGRNRKKIAIGIYPLEKISLPINYTSKKPSEIKFIPLESEKEMSADEILKNHPTGKAYSHLLADFDRYPVFIDSKNKILSLPPIINSNETGRITPETKEVFIECSGNDFEILKKTLNIIVTTLLDQGGKAYSMTLDYQGKKETTPSLNPEKIKVSLDKINRHLGLDLKEKDLEKIIPKMGYDYKSGVVYVPAWRTDILHEVDIIEDIAIAYGYENIKPELPKVSTIAEETKESKIKSRISEILIGLGLLEVSSYHLIKEEEKSGECIEVQNSKTEYKFLRPSLKIPALRILSENKDNEYPQNIFEIGKVFSKDSRKESGVSEPDNLCISLCPGNFTQIKQILDYICNSLDFSYELKEKEEKPFIQGRTGEILINNKTIGILGEIHPDNLKSWGIKMPVSLLEINLEEIFNSKNQPK